MQVFMHYKCSLILIIRILFVELHQNTCELLRLVFTLCAFFLLLLRFTYNFQTQGYDILYLWTFPDSGTPTSNATSPRAKGSLLKKGLLPVEVRNLAHQVYYALYHRHLHLVGLAGSGDPGISRFGVLGIFCFVGSFERRS